MPTESRTQRHFPTKFREAHRDGRCRTSDRDRPSECGSRGQRPPKSANATMMGVPFEARERVRLGIIGVGGRGTSLLGDLLAVENVEVKAICDLVPEKVAHAQKMVTDAGQPEPTGFSKGETDFKNLTAARTRHRLHRDSVELARPDGARRHEKRQACCRRSARLHDVAGVLGHRRHVRGHAQALHDSGELLLRRHRDDGPGHGARWTLRRNHARRSGLSPRPARHSDGERRRRLVAPLSAHEAEWQSVSDARTRARSRTTWTSIAATASTTWFR